jgi:zinc/manganese transport system permease protein
MLFSRTIGTRLAIGWTMGAIVTGVGILVSFKEDLPTGATIVCTFGVALALMALARLVTRKGVVRAERA